MSQSDTSLAGGPLFLRKMTELRRDIAAAVDGNPERYDVHHDAFPVETLHALADELGLRIRPEHYTTQELRERISDAVDCPMESTGRRHLNKPQLVALYTEVVPADGRDTQ